jgi:hypothetical protein
MRNSKLRKKGKLGATALVHQSVLAGCAREGDRATSGSPGAALGVRSRSSPLSSRRQFTTKGRVGRSRRSEFRAQNGDFSQFAVHADYDDFPALTSPRVNGPLQRGTVEDERPAPKGPYKPDQGKRLGPSTGAKPRQLDKGIETATAAC